MSSRWTLRVFGTCEWQDKRVCTSSIMHLVETAASLLSFPVPYEVFIVLFSFFFFSLPRLVHGGGTECLGTPCNYGTICITLPLEAVHHPPSFILHPLSQFTMYSGIVVVI